MDTFFNELSISIAQSDDIACGWLENLAHIGKLLKNITEPLQDEQFTFRRNYDFSQIMITETKNISDFMCERFDHSDPVYIFLLGIFDSPYITENDPQRTEYDLTSITFDNVTYNEPTGIAAAYLKNSLVVSFDSDIRWDRCLLDTLVNSIDSQSRLIISEVQVRNCSKREHIIICHSEFFSGLFDWSKYKPFFDSNKKLQNILNLKEIYSLFLGEDINSVWGKFYSELTSLDAAERVSRILKMAEHIAKIQNWIKSKDKNDRTVYEIPNSDFLISVDTQHGEFEVHKNQKGNNHLGSISFDGKYFKPQVHGRKLKV